MGRPIRKGREEKLGVGAVGGAGVCPETSRRPSPAHSPWAVSHPGLGCLPQTPGGAEDHTPPFPEEVNAQESRTSHARLSLGLHLCEVGDGERAPPGLGARGSLPAPTIRVQRGRGGRGRATGGAGAGTRWEGPRVVVQLRAPSGGRGTSPHYCDPCRGASLRRAGAPSIQPGAGTAGRGAGLGAGWAAAWHGSAADRWRRAGVQG